MILMIDNYDSFTYNIAQYLGELGVELTVWRNDQFTLQDIEALCPQAIVISPGPCTPNDAGMSLEVIDAFHSKIPLFGVCLGHQSIGQYFGGNVVHADYLMHGKTCSMFHNGDPMFRGIESPFTATRYHSLIVERDSLPSCLTITAETEKGEIMAFRHQSYPIFGVQFHPESYSTTEGKTIFLNFLDHIGYNAAVR
jgi:para-aminobenzoate synthetase component 2